jgi:uncharacterized damage-inducible protein DinB
MRDSDTQSNAQDLASKFHEANAGVVAFVDACPLKLWSYRTKEEGWTLSMAAAHIAMSHLGIARWLHRITSGLDVPETEADISACNASDERYNSALSQPEVAERLRIYGAALERFVTDLTEEQLASRALYFGRECSAEDMVRAAILHPTEHLYHMMAATAAIA